MHEALRIVEFVFPLILLISVIFFFRGVRMPDMKSHEERMEQIQSVARSARVEQSRFQEELLGQLKRHNAAMERQAEARTRILERLEREEPA